MPRNTSLKARSSKIPALQGSNLRDRVWHRFLRGPDQELLECLYVPALRAAVTYDRCCSYFSSTVLAAAARGFGAFIERLVAAGEPAPGKRPAVRLVVNEELDPDDVQAMVETGDTTALADALRKRLKTPKDVLERQRLEMLGWLVQQGHLAMRVGVMRSTAGIVHGKFGIATDAAGDAIVFAGSGNESGSGLRSNYETLEVSTSWGDAERHRHHVDEFEELWTDKHPFVHTVDLPEALRLKLIKFAPKEPPFQEPSNALSRQKAAMVWQFLVESPYLSDPAGGRACDATGMVDLWPHQVRVVEETTDVWPAGRLCCDAVGLGKSLEGIGILRRLMAGRGVRRALLLVPAGLLRQWQAECREKGGLIIPRLEGLGTLVWPDDREEQVAGLAGALEQDVLMMSRETARTEANLGILLQAEPWDFVLLDEAHAARRKKQEEGDFNAATLLLNLLRELQLRGKVRGFLLLSATPMQTSPWEPWDLLQVLGTGGRWMADFGTVRRFYGAAEAIRNGTCTRDMARAAARIVLADTEFPRTWDGQSLPANEDGLTNRLEYVMPSQREAFAAWLRQNTPLGRRMHRNTRDTLRRYYEMGLLAYRPPQRVVEDVLYDFSDAGERQVYDGIRKYIERRFEELEHEKPGKGFVMTVYRRRASSSPLALERSLERRRQGLLRVASKQTFSWNLENEDIPEALDGEDLPEEDVDKVSAAMPSDPKSARSELDDVGRLLDSLRALQGRDSKRDTFFEILRRVTEDGRAVIVFTEYTDTLDYLRDALVGHYGAALACYSGSGGQTWKDGQWHAVTKDRITRALREGHIRVLLGTDAMAEGLNLQAAGALINYDLPWNPSKVEQRIGRIDRIGQLLPVIRVVNMFLANSVDQQVYEKLRMRCGLFEHFVGSMQPVLAKARKMLMAKEATDLGALESLAGQVEQDPTLSGAMVESLPIVPTSSHPSVARQDLVDALALLTDDIGFKVKADKGGTVLRVQGAAGKAVLFAAEFQALEHDKTLLPLSPLEPSVRAIAQELGKTGERLPLVVAASQSGAYRKTVAFWVADGGMVAVESLVQLKDLVDGWDGVMPDPAAWQQAMETARTDAARMVRALRTEHESRYRSAMNQQVEAARLRLLRDLGRYLMCAGNGDTDLNGVWHHSMLRDIAGAARLKNCHDRLGGWVEWDAAMLSDLASEYEHLAGTQKKARLLGSELDAALQDPRWKAREIPASN